MQPIAGGEMLNTNTLGYKLVHGKLKKHSEQLNKFVAGLFDADGWICWDFCRNKPQLQSGIVLSASSDPDFEVLRALQRHYRLGTIIYRAGIEDTHASQCRWTLRTKDSKMLFNLLGKHLRIKGTLFKELVETHSDVTLSDEDIKSLKDRYVTLRKDSKWLKQPKHPSWSWVSGYLAGDGHFEFSKRLRPSGNYNYSLRVSAVAHEDDEHVLEFLQVAFGGSILRSNKNPDSPNYHCKVWRRGVGKGHRAFALRFLRSVRQYMCLINKYNTVNEMVKYLEQGAETK